MKRFISIIYLKTQQGDIAMLCDVLTIPYRLVPVIKNCVTSRLVTVLPEA